MHTLEGTIVISHRLQTFNLQLLYGAGIQTQPPFITVYLKHKWIIHIKRCPRISFQHYRSLKNLYSDQCNWLQWGMKDGTGPLKTLNQKEKKHRSPIGCVLLMGTPYRCKWYTLSGYPRTSLHSCCWAEWISQRKEGLKTANGVDIEGTAVSFTEGRCWVKGDLAPGKDWVKNHLRLGFMSL